MRHDEPNATPRPSYIAPPKSGPTGRSKEEGTTGCAKMDRRLAVLIFAFLYCQFLVYYGWMFVPTQNVDFPTFYWLAKLLVERDRSPYDYAELARAGASSGQQILPCTYPPPTLLVYCPLATMSYQTAKTALLVVNHVCFLLFVWLFFFRIMRWSLADPFVVFAVVFTFLFYPIVLTLNHGQVNLIVLVLLCLAWYGLRENLRAYAVAFPLSLAILIKTYPAFLLLYLLCKRRWGVVLWAMGLLALYAGTAYAVFPRVVWSDWWRGVVPSGGYGREHLGVISSASPWNQSANGFLSRIFLSHGRREALFPSGTAARSAPYPVAVLMTMAVCWLARRNTGNDRPLPPWRLDIELSLCLVTMFLVAPYSWLHHLVLILPALLVAVRLFVDSSDARALGTAAVVAAFVLAWNIPCDAAILQRGALSLLISTDFFCVTVIWSYLVLRLRRATSRAAAVD